jgi:ketosteroid isomerase-like protein
MQKRFVLGLLLGLTFLTTLTAQAQDKATEQTLLSLVKQLVEAQRTFDAAAMDKLLTADYIEVSPVGEVDERAKVLSFYSPAAKAAAGEAPAMTIDEPTYRLQKNTAIVIVRESFKRKMGDQMREVAMRVLFTFRQESGGWRIASAQYTGVRPAPSK